MFRAERAALSIFAALAEAFRGCDTRNALSFNLPVIPERSGWHGLPAHHIFQLQFLLLDAVDQIIIGSRSGIFYLQHFFQFGVLLLHGRHMIVVHRDLPIIVGVDTDPFDLPTHVKEV
jgi:hypothetical protein